MSNHVNVNQDHKEIPFYTNKLTKIKEVQIKHISGGSVD